MTWTRQYRRTDASIPGSPPPRSGPPLALRPSLPFRPAGRTTGLPKTGRRRAGDGPGGSRPAGSRSARPAQASRSAWMSSFRIPSIAFIVRSAFAGSGSASSLGSSLGTICQETPYRSLSQPH